MLSLFKVKYFPHKFYSEAIIEILTKILSCFGMHRQSNMNGYTVTHHTMYTICCIHYTFYSLSYNYKEYIPCIM